MNGEGVGEIDGKIVFVPGTIQDEIVDCSIVKDCKNYWYHMCNYRSPYSYFLWYINHHRIQAKGHRAS